MIDTDLNSYKTMYGPKAANSSFTIGMNNNGGGFALQKDYIPDQDVYIGYEEDGCIHCLPYFLQQVANLSESFVKKEEPFGENQISCFSSDEIKRNLSIATDTFEARKMKYEIFTSSSGVPDPVTADITILKNELLPAILSRLTIDNRNGVKSIRGFFAISPIKGKILLSEAKEDALVGIASIEGYGFATTKNSNVHEFGEFDLCDFIKRDKPIPFQLAPIGGIYFDVPAGGCVSVDIALGFFKGEVVTAGTCFCKYYYTNYFHDLVDVLRYALEIKESKITESKKASKEFDLLLLNKNRKFIISQAIRCYYASSMLFDDNGTARWVVNEGSYMMMNTFDLTVDHLFFELDKHTWAVKNVLDVFINQYSYEDTVHFYETPEISYKGGISFTHDQGVFNVFSKRGTSSYEITEQDGCFSFMTQEQLCNFVLCSALYVKKTNDVGWLKVNADIMKECLHSMENRDHPDPAHRDGIMDLDSNQCGTKGEITTYDSLDHSLGQARRNLYLGVKCWATYIALEYMMDIINAEEKNAAKNQALKCADTISKFFDERLRYIPAILNGVDQSAIIPAIEGLIYPFLLGRKDAISDSGAYSSFILALKNHFNTVLRKGCCLFEDFGWKLSANSTNSWISKIFLCQFVAENVLEIDMVDKNLYDQAHALWWKVGCPANPGIDQIFSGTQNLSNFHYPRGITSYLWMIH